MRRRTRLLSAPLCAALIAGAACSAHAAELGDPRVVSHVGQQLVADIELTLLEDPNTPVQVRLASPEVYSEAGIAVPSVLSSLTLSVMRRDGRQFLHATTLRPVDADHLHLYLELVDHGQRAVRLATLWLTPDPNPAPAHLAAPALSPTPTPAPSPAPARAGAEAAAGTPAHALAAARPAPPAPAHLSAPDPKPAPPVPASKPAAPAPASTPVRPAAVTKPAPPALAPGLVPLPVHARPAACLPQSGEAQACAVLGARNAELRARIGQLEQRVEGLRASLGAGEPGKPGKPGRVVAAPPPSSAPAGRASPAPQSAAAARPQTPKPAAHALEPKPDAHAQDPKPAAPPPGPAPIASIKPLVPHKPKRPPPDDDLPWGMIGATLAALAALGGGAALLLARRKRAPRVDVPVQPGMLPRLRERFFTRNGGKDLNDPASAPMAEPTLK